MLRSLLVSRLIELRPLTRWRLESLRDHWWRCRLFDLAQLSSSAARC